uniref:Uncharacterized protein n=1 Tax=Helianthus annuus TaxID=4232 RepID=A0A251RZN4_HELAN
MFGLRCAHCSVCLKQSTSTLNIKVVYVINMVSKTIYILCYSSRFFHQMMIYLP